MAVQTYDPYPLETTWRETLPIDSVLHALEYGLMSEFIFDKVKEIRSTKRHLKVQSLIKSITQENLQILWQHILRDAKALESFHNKAWTFGKTTKAGRIDFFERNDISIKYLEECLELQKKGAECTFEVDDLVIISTGQGIIDESYKVAGIVTNVYRSTLDVNLVKVKTESYNPQDSVFVVGAPNSKVRYNINPMWHRSLRYQDHTRCTKKRVRFTRCVKVGTYTQELKQKRSDWVKNYNYELNKWREFWNRYFMPVIGTMGTWGMPILIKNTMLQSWFCQENVIWDKKKPIYYNEEKCLVYSRLRCFGGNSTLYNNQWEVFKEIMDEKLDDFIRDYRP